MAKEVQHGVFENGSKVLVSLEDFTSMRGQELLQGVYLLVIGYRLNHVESVKKINTLKGADKSRAERGRSNSLKDTKEGVKGNIEAVKSEDGSEMAAGNKEGAKGESALPQNSPDVEDVGGHENCVIKPFNAKDIKLFKDAGTPENGEGLSDVFFAWYYPLVWVQRNKKYTFNDGLPLFYGEPGLEASIFVAVLEVDKPCDVKLDEVWPVEKGARSAAFVRSKTVLDRSIKRSICAALEIDQKLEEIDRDHQYKMPRTLRKHEKEIGRDLRVIKNSFSLLIKEMEKKALLANHQIRYSNVFTFRSDDEWLEGDHKNWGDHRMAMTINIEVSR